MLKHESRTQLLATSAFLVFLASSLAAGAVAQSRIEQIVERAIADFDEPAKIPDAVRRLENLGAAAVQPLRQRLQAREKLTSAACVQIVFVLGRLARTGLPALPELLRLLNDPDRDVGNQIVWTFVALAPFCDGQACGQILAAINAAPTGVRNSYLAYVARASIALGDGAPPEKLPHLLLSYNHAEQAAACRWIVARPDRCGDERDSIQRVLGDCMDAALVRAPIRWCGPLPSPALGDLAEAWLALSSDAIDARTARCLLEHERADMRQRGVAWMKDNGNVLPMRERADLVGRLWDTDAAVARAAAEALAAWGIEGLVALPCLRLLQRTTTGVVSEACGKAADTMLAASAKLPAVEHEWLQAFDAAFRNTTVVAPGKPCPEDGRVRIADLLFLAQWNDAATLGRALDLAVAAGPLTDGVLQAVFGWLTDNDAAVTGLASAWLALRATAVGKAIAEQGEPANLARAALLHASGERDGPALELLLHVLDAGPAEDLRSQLEIDNGRLLPHAIARELAKPTPRLAALASRLQQLLAEPGRQTLEMRVDRRRIVINFDFTTELRTMIAIALADAHVALIPPAGLDDALRTTIGVGVEELEAHVAELRRNGRLVQLLDKIEDRCRAVMGIPAHLRWPSVADAK